MIAPLTPVAKIAQRRVPPADLARYARSEFREDEPQWLILEALDARRGTRAREGRGALLRGTSAFRRLARTVLSIFL